MPVLPLPPPPPPRLPDRGMPRLAPEVPVIPEADSFPLLAGGLLALDGLAAWGLRRRT